MSNASLKEQLQAVALQLGKEPEQASKKTLGKETEKEQTEPRKEQNIHKVFLAKEKYQAQKLPKFSKPKPRWLEYAQYGVELLKVYFPLSFKSGSQIQPLKKGTKEELVKRLSMMDNIVIEDKACMVKSLSYYVNTIFYHQSVREGAFRIDLDGKQVGSVTAEEALYSAEKRQAKVNARKAGKAIPPQNRERSGA